MRVAARNREKFTITPIFGGSGSFKVIDVNAKGNVWQRCLFEGPLRTNLPPLLPHRFIDPSNWHLVWCIYKRLMAPSMVPPFRPYVRGDPLRLATWNFVTKYYRL